MKRLGWYVLRVTVAVFVLCGALLLAANLYVQSRSVQQRIRTELAATLKMPVSLRKTTVTPWDGVRLDGVVLRASGVDGPAGGDQDAGQDFVSAASFRVKFAWWPLLTQRRLIVEQVLLDQPLVTVRDGFNPFSGQEREVAAEVDHPTPPPAGSPGTSPSQTPTPAGSPQVARESPAPTPPTAEPPAEEKPRPALVKNLPMLVDRLRLRHGKLTYVSREKRPLVQVDDINLDGTTPDPQHAHGAVWFARAGGEHGGAALTDYWTAVDFDAESGLVVRDGRGKVGGGMLNTDFRLEPREGRLAFSTTAKLENAALAQFTSHAADQPPVAEGQLHGSLDFHGFTDDPASHAGGGKVWLVGAKLHDLPLMNLAGQMLHIPDLAHLEFKQAEMDYKLEGTVLHIDPLTLVANDAQVVIRGSYLTEERRLDLHGRLTIDQAISHQLPQFIESNFTACGKEAPGCRYIDFDVTGPPDDPQSNLYERVVSGPMKGLLDNLMAPKPKNPEEPKTRRLEKSEAVAGSLADAVIRESRSSLTLCE